MQTVKETRRSMIVFEPHADDAEWWTGGLTLLLKEINWDVHYACITKTPNRHEATASAKILSVQRHFLEITLLGNSNLDHDLMNALVPLINAINPSIVLIPSRTDYHKEHVVVAKKLFDLFIWAGECNLPPFEVYAYDSHMNRELVEVFIDISSVWEKQLDALRCHKAFERKTIPENTLVRVKTGRAMVLGTSWPDGNPVHFAEGYRILRGDAKKISLLAELLPGKFCYRSPETLLYM